MADHQDAAAEVAACYAALPCVEAVALAGSSTTGAADRSSDIDLYVYSPDGVPVEARAAILRSRAPIRAELDNRFWETGDQWDELRPDRKPLHVDVMFRTPTWIENELGRVLDRHEALLGYTTALWHNLRTSRILFDRHGWLAALKRTAGQSYPAPLAQAIMPGTIPYCVARSQPTRARSGERPSAWTRCPSTTGSPPCLRAISTCCSRSTACHIPVRSAC